jgi:sigma-B regulation protein RsbQ
MEQNYIGWANYLAPVVSGPQGEGSGHETATLTDSFCSTDPTAARIFAQATFFADNRADVPRVPCPCLVLQHRHDTLAPLSVGAYLQAHLAHGTLEILDVTGHCGHMSHPELVIEAMRGYLATPAR